MAEHFVIVGGGQAAAQAIQTARGIGYAGKITLLAGEPFLPYQRPPLSKKYLAGEISRERLQLKPQSFYDSRDIGVMLATRVEELDLARRKVRLADDRAIDYDRLLIATGSRVRRLNAPGTDLEGIHYLRSISDVDAIAQQLQPNSKLVIVGAGYIGLEVAAVAVRRQAQVTVLEAADRIMQRVVCRETAEFLAAYHRRAGVEIHCATQVSAFRGNGRVAAVESTSGASFPCDLVIIGIGIVPNAELAEQAGLSCGNGIHVDEFARTEDPAVSAAGDCTNQFRRLVGTRVRLESVHNAVEQGKSAAALLLGQPRPFDDVPWFWSDQYDLKLQIAGLALEYDTVVVRGPAANTGFAVYYLRGGRVIAVDAVNSPRDFLNGKKLVAARVSIPPGIIADPGADLSRFLA